MESPSPVPPNLRVVEASTCEKGLNSVLIPAAEIPTPVSRTSQRTVVPNSSRATTLMSMAISPRSVNYTALPPRFSSICRRRPASPFTIDGSVGSISAVTSRPFGWA
jgi:hypothetical protein